MNARRSLFAALVSGALVGCAIGRDFDGYAAAAAGAPPASGSAAADAAATQAFGWLYVIGGSDDGRRSDEVYRSAIDAAGTPLGFELAGVLPRGLSAFATVRAGKDVFLIAGDDDEGPHPSVFTARFAGGVLGAFSETRGLGGALTGTTAIAAGSRLFVFGGTTGGDDVSKATFVGTIEDGKVGGWSPSANALPEPRGRAVSVVLGGWVHVIGGSSALSGTMPSVVTAPLGATDIGSWRNNKPLPSPRTSAGAVALSDTTVLVVGGSRGGVDVGGETYIGTMTDQGDLRFDEGPPLEHGLERFAITSFDARFVYVVGGRFAGKSEDLVRYAPIEPSGRIGNWRRGPDLPRALQRAGAVAIRGDE